MTAPTKKAGGFTLLELLIAVALVAILTLIAYPSYKEHVYKGRRVVAKEALMSVAQTLERCLAQYGSYNAAACPVTSGTGLSASASTTDGGHYLLNGAVNADSYTLNAVPQGDQSNDRCGTLSLSSTGLKQATGDYDADGVPGDPDDDRACWES